MEKGTGTEYHLDDVYYDYASDLKNFDPANYPGLTIENTSFYATEEDGCLYHYCGNARIKVHEHFADHGKRISELIENVILHTAKTTI